MKDLRLKLAAGYPAVALLTHEEARAEHVLAKLCEDLEKSIFIWTLTQGLRDMSNDGDLVEETEDPDDMLSKVESLLDEDRVFVLKDFHHHLESAMTVRRIRDLIPHMKAVGAHFVFLGPEFNPPSDLQREIVKVNFTFPDRGELEKILDGICETNKVELDDNGQRDALIEAGLGLTSLEYEDALAESLADCEGDLDPKVVSRVKCEIVAASGILELVKSEDLPEVGGNKNLIEWMELRRGTFGKKAREYGLEAPKGVLLVGRPGCGKSLVGKLAAKFLDVPYVWYADPGKFKDKYVGESERKTREFFDAVEASAPNAVLIDEIDKVGPGSGTSDTSGVEKNMLGTMLSRMQDKPKDKMVFFIFTANSIAGIPPALLRRGRIDEIFLVDLPDAFERREIIEVHLKLRGRDPKNFKPEVIAEACNDFTGAEIEAAIKEAMVIAFQEDREFTDKDIISAMTNMSPQSHLQPEVATEFEDWIKKGKAKPASKRAKNEVYKIKTGARKVKGVKGAEDN